MEKAALESSLNQLDIWLIVFGIFVAVGVVGESVVGYMHWRRGNQLQAVQTSEILGLQKATADANARALEARLALEEFKAPRELSDEQQERITAHMSGFDGLRVVIGAVPPTVRNTTLAAQILNALTAAHVDAFINLTGVEAEVSPTGASHRGQMLTTGVPLGISVFFHTGNERGQAFAGKLAQALNDQGIIATAVGDWREGWVIWQMQQHGIDRNDKTFEPVTIAVGDKP